MRHAQQCICCVHCLLTFPACLPLVSILSPSIATYAMSRLGYASVGGIGAGTMALLGLLIYVGVVDAAPIARTPKQHL